MVIRVILENPNTQYEDSTFPEHTKIIKRGVNESMNIRDNIRKAIKEDVEAKKYNKWNPDSQPNIYTLDNFLRKSGYRLLEIIPHEESGLELIIEPMKEGHPEIVHDTEDNKFYMKPLKTSLLNAKATVGIIKVYSSASGVLNYLDQLNLNKLEINKE